MTRARANLLSNQRPEPVSPEREENKRRRASLRSLQPEEPSPEWFYAVTERKIDTIRLVIRSVLFK